jgi:hypothetical protein
MPVPWLQILDAVVGVANFARTRRAAPANPPTEEQYQQQQMEAATRTPGGLEARMAGVVVAALKEAFDRDNRRLELEREQLAAEREGAERALRLELQRQAADLEIGRLRLLAGIAIAGWLVTLLLAAWPGSRMVATTGARVALGVGWLLLSAALAASFAAQGQVATAMAGAVIPGATPTNTGVSSGVAGVAAPWLIMAGLAMIGAAALIA